MIRLVLFFHAGNLSWDAIRVVERSHPSNSIRCLVLFYLAFKFVVSLSLDDGHAVCLPQWRFQHSSCTSSFFSVPWSVSCMSYIAIL